MKTFEIMSQRVSLNTSMFLNSRGGQNTSRHWKQFLGGVAQIQSRNKRYSLMAIKLASEGRRMDTQLFYHINKVS